MLGYTVQDLKRMQEIVLYSAQDSLERNDEESHKWLTATADFIEGLIVEGRI